MNRQKKEARLAEKEKQKQALIEGRDERKQQEEEDMDEDDMDGDQEDGSDQDNENGSDSDMDEYGDEDSEDSDEIAELPSQNEMKRDLIMAIEEELRE